jgi:hypothetical protein
LGCVHYKTLKFSTQPQAIVIVGDRLPCPHISQFPDMVPGRLGGGLWH